MSQNIDFNKSNFYLRLDERLAVPLKYAYVSTILKFQNGEDVHLIFLILS